ncbi:inhibitor of the pro-sigma K processing machinery [Sporomusaceae bacterium BoRhaA]|uniref:pro-sigmaK processing inhibitor BofA family protein n=1 Tax=Pelorhabdus rhamnosifermentans TaxID=2772457 RepID=UPI001C0624C4|nr:pro-sigmaK processing inhibitor BofA family protein [Pelorhabdus rhamnosifermentans]MBU2703762.1 inhibitor of the pro-sigma K processing machinery [Pelorhabdus rhamnosifermentans]
MPTTGIGLDLNVILAYLFGIILILFVGKIFLMPLKLVFKLLYNGVVGGIMLYVINFIGIHFGFTIALNPVTALVAGFLGIPGIVLLILFKIFIN